MTFGKLGGNPIAFLSRPYEQCLSGIAVTHMPRYLIDMRLEQGETIFDKMGIPYDTLRTMDNPIAPVAKYYRSKLKEGESLWWTGDSTEETVAATIRLWKNIPTDDKRFYTVYGCVNFPEVFGGNYDRYSMWLASQGIVDPHIRDQFSAGGREEMRLSDGEIVRLPGVYRRIKCYPELFLKRLAQENPKDLIGTRILDSKGLNSRFMKWAETVSKNSTISYDISMNVLNHIFQKHLSRLS